MPESGDRQFVDVHHCLGGGENSRDQHFDDGLKDFHERVNVCLRFVVGAPLRIRCAKITADALAIAFQR